MSGPAPKPPTKRQRRGTKALGVVHPTPIRPAPRGLCAQARACWTRYWSDTVAGVVRASDESLVLRWVANVDRCHRLMAVADAEPLVRGSTGQLRVHPAYALALKIEASIKADEAQFGIGPLNRLRLGVSLAEQAKSLAELNAESEGGDDPDADPRIGLLRGPRGGGGGAHPKH